MAFAIPATPTIGTRTVPFHTYILKIASRCNLNCKYCFIYNSADSRWKIQPQFMSETIARKTAYRILEHCRTHSKTDIEIVLHGGEPLLGGVSHLSMLASVIKETFSGSDIAVKLSMQSNGILLTREICEFMQAEHIRTGISLDGPPEINDIYRVDHEGKPSSHRLEDSLKLLTSSYPNIWGGFLCVINIFSDPIRVTEYLMSYSPSNIDFLFPLNNYNSRPPGKETDVNATPYGDWLIKVFDYWFYQDTQTSIRIFYNIIRLIFGVPSSVEYLGLTPADLIVIETNGDIEGVDSLKSTYDGATKLGYNVFNDSFDSVATNSAVRSRLVGGLDALCQKCKECPVVNICGGGYMPHRYSSDNGFDNPSIYSSDLEKLIRYIHAAVSREMNNKEKDIRL
jgi:uncharacterized protein